jgi:hypothetical protein
MITPSNRSTESSNRQESVTTDQSQQLTYEELLAQRIAQDHIAVSKRFGIPLWVLRDPGPRVEVEDDDVAFEEGT